MHQNETVILRKIEEASDRDETTKTQSICSKRSNCLISKRIVMNVENSSFVALSNWPRHTRANADFFFVI